MTDIQKKPLNYGMSQYSRRRRVSDKREVLEKWAEEEGVTVTQLLGYLLHLENYHAGDKSIAAIGWRIFTGEHVFVKPEVTVQEAIWMIEIGRISQVVW